jgi:hypothetical protein
MFINHDLKAIFLHNPKCGGAYVRSILTCQYGFEFIAGEDIHQHYESFFDNSIHVKLDEDTDSHTIRKKGLWRYYVSHQNTQKRYFENYFVFTFVRNPYDRLFSAYNYLYNMLLMSPNKDKIRGSYEKIEYLESFEKFVENREMVNNISFFHAFIPQYEHLVDEFGKIKVQYIGRQENLDNDLLEIFSILDVRELHHTPIFSKNIRMNSSNNNNKNLLSEKYTEEIFNFVNSHFANDFEIFGYKKYKTFEEFQQSIMSEESFIHEKTKMKRMNLLKDLNVIYYKKNDLMNLVEKNEKILSILLEQLVQNRENSEQNDGVLLDVKNFNKDMKAAMLNSKRELRSIVENMTEYVKEQIDKSVCDFCKDKFITHNKLAKDAHCFFCK